MARQPRAEQTRATIIEAAADLFDRHGYESTSLSDIVAHARVTKGALYFHFASKEDLVHAIMDLQYRSSLRIAKEIDGQGHPSLEVLMRITFAITRLALEEPIARAGLRLAVGRVELRHPFRHPFREWVDIAAARLLDAVKESDVQPDVDVEVVAHSIICFFVGSRMVGRTLEPRGPQLRRIGEMWRLLVQALVPVPRRAHYLGLAGRLERECGNS
ncbi:ScbR family autoregulator-binding transcription factor [Streptomyces sp. NPDC058466]|uniref:ScbR family autoregulator-binding transcription factor n=1 Tax=Streptomyces sp. NPDC058466 TaxID=3346512 RepID=UPI00365AF739